MVAVSSGPARPRAVTLIDPFELTPAAASTVPRSLASGEVTPGDAAPQDVPPPLDGSPSALPHPGIIDAAAPAESLVASAVSTDAVLGLRQGPISAQSPRAQGWCSEE